MDKVLIRIVRFGSLLISTAWKLNSQLTLWSLLIPAVCNAVSPIHEIQTAHAGTHTNTPLWDNGSTDSYWWNAHFRIASTRVHLCPPHQHAFESGVTHGSSVPLLDFMSGWAEKTEWDMRQLISTLTLGWTALTSSCLLLLTDWIMYKQRLKWKCPCSRKRKM